MLRGKLIILLFILPAFLIAQTFTAKTDATKVYENNTFRVIFEFNNMEDQGFEPPDFSPFEVVGGPSQSSSYSFINGQQTSSKSYTYTLLAEKKGRFTIPGATAIINGQRKKSNSVSIQIVASNVAGNMAKDDTGMKFMVDLKPDYTKAYVGQQITLDYVIYVQQDVRQFDILNEPKYDGFYSEQVIKSNFPTQQVEINGEAYFTKIMKRVALFPQQTGDFTIEPIVVKIGVVDPNARRTGFFGTRRLKTLTVKTEPITISVLEEPSDAPKDFSGAIGKFQLKTSINKNKITTDDAVVLVQEVRGDGDEKTIIPPKINNTETWEVYDPKTILEQTQEYNGKFYTVKQFEYLMVPRKTGLLDLNIGFTFYDPDSLQYVTLKDRNYRVHVIKGNRSVTSDKREVVPLNDIYEPDKTNNSTDTIGDLRTPNSWWMSFGVLCMGLLGFVGFKKYRLIKEENIDPALKRKILAEKEAARQLADARSLMEANKLRDFYDEISKATTRYLSKKYQIPFSEQNKEGITAALKNQHISQNHIDGYLSILQSCEMALFAGQSSTPMDEVFEKTKTLLSEIELS